MHSLSQRLNARLEAEPQRGAFPRRAWERDRKEKNCDRCFNIAALFINKITNYLYPNIDLLSRISLYSYE